MFKKKTKKTGIQTPELRNPTPPPPIPRNPNLGYQPVYTSTQNPPPPPTSGSNAVKPNPNYVPPTSVVQPKEEHRVIRRVYKSLVDTKDKIHLLTSNPDYADMLKIENADVYWNDKNGAVIVVTTQEWKDYLLGKRDTPIIEKESTNEQE